MCARTTSIARFSIWIRCANFKRVTINLKCARDSQLREQQNLRTAFNGFRELDPNFKPTYKYDVGTSRWDSRFVRSYHFVVVFLRFLCVYFLAFAVRNGVCPHGVVRLLAYAIREANKLQIISDI